MGEKYGVSMIMVTQLVQIERVVSEIVADLNRIISDSYKKGMSACGELTEYYAIKSIDELI